MSITWRFYHLTILNSLRFSFILDDSILLLDDRVTWLFYYIDASIILNDSITWRFSSILGDSITWRFYYLTLLLRFVSIAWRFYSTWTLCFYYLKSVLRTSGPGLWPKLAWSWPSFWQGFCSPSQNNVHRPGFRCGSMWHLRIQCYALGWSAREALRHSFLQGEGVWEREMV